MALHSVDSTHSGTMHKVDVQWVGILKANTGRVNAFTATDIFIFLHMCLKNNFRLEDYI